VQYGTFSTAPKGYVRLVVIRVRVHLGWLCIAVRAIAGSGFPWVDKPFGPWSVLT
jgi:hypothetical protein